MFKKTQNSLKKRVGCSNTKNWRAGKHHFKNLYYFIFFSTQIKICIIEVCTYIFESIIMEATSYIHDAILDKQSLIN